MKTARDYAQSLYDSHITTKGFAPFVNSAEHVFRDAIRDARDEILSLLSPELAADIRAEIGDDR